MVEVNAETDFVARNETFQAFVEATAKIALQVGEDLDTIKAAPFPGTGRTVAEELTQLVATIGENMNLRRAVAIAVNPGVVSAYVHNPASPELGKIGVLVALKSSADKAKLAALGKQIAMHVAAAAPLALTPEHLPKDVLDRERAVQADVARQSGKPENVVQKMLEGRMRKFYEESVLLNQTFVIDGETQISKVLEKASKDLGAPVEIAGFVRFQVGEGIDKEDGDFAGEVSRMAGR